jgi:hypothetical protein
MRMLLLAAFPLVLGAAAGCQEQAAALPTAAASPAISPNVPAVEPAVERALVQGPAAITWDQLDVGIPPESVFEPWMMKTSIKSLYGQMVSITGFIQPGVPVSTGIRQFVLLRNIDCPYGRQGEAHHAMIVELQGDLRIDYTQKPITVEGTFHVQPLQGPDRTTWALYALDGVRVSPDSGALPAAAHTPETPVTP